MHGETVKCTVRNSCNHILLWYEVIKVGSKYTDWRSVHFEDLVNLCTVLIQIRSQWLRDLRRRFAADRLLRLWVRIPPEAWMFVVSCVVRGICDESVTRPRESYRLWCCDVFDLDIWRMRRPWPALGRSTRGEEKYWLRIIHLCVSTTKRFPNSYGTEGHFGSTLCSYLSISFKTYSRVITDSHGSDWDLR